MLPGLLPGTVHTVKLLKSGKKGSLNEGSIWPSKTPSEMCPPTSLWKGKGPWPMSHMSQSCLPEGSAH